MIPYTHWEEKDIPKIRQRLLNLFPADPNLYDQLMELKRSAMNALPGIDMLNESDMDDYNRILMWKAEIFLGPDRFTKIFPTSIAFFSHK